MSAQALPNRVEDVRSLAAPLPVKRSLTPAFVASIAIAALVAMAALTSVIIPHTIYPTEALILAYLSVDGFHLAVGLPVLIASMVLARRGHLAGLLCWPGALLYVLYSYITNLVGVPFGPLFLPYVLLVALSAYTTIAVVAAIDAEAVQRRFDGAVPSRLAGGVVAGLTALFTLVNVVNIFVTLANPTAGSPAMAAIWIADFVAVGPACLIGGVLLWRRTPLGHVAGPGLLLMYSLLLIGLGVALAYPALPGPSHGAVDAFSIVLMLVLGGGCLALLALFIRGANRGRSPDPTTQTL